MKIRVGKDERYPDYFVTTTSYEPELEITDEEYAQIKAADEAYEAAQKILARAFDR